MRIADNPPAVNPPELDGKPFPRSPLLGKTIRARAVLSNGNLLGTIFDLVGEEKFDDAFIAGNEKVRLNNSNTQVYMAIKPEEALDADRCGDLLFTSVAPEFDAETLLSKEITSRTYSFYYPKTRLEPIATTSWRAPMPATKTGVFFPMLIIAPPRATDRNHPRFPRKICSGDSRKSLPMSTRRPRTFKDYTAHWGASFVQYEGWRSAAPFTRMWPDFSRRECRHYHVRMARRRQLRYDRRKRCRSVLTQNRRNE